MKRHLVFRWLAFVSMLGLLFGLPIVSHAQKPNVAKDPARNKAVAWLKANNRFGPSHKLVKDMTEAIDQELEEGQDVSLTFGPGLMKSDKATIISLFAGEFFSFELTNAQATQHGVSKSGASVYASKRSDRRAPANAKLASLKIDSAPNLEGNKKITGQVSVQALQKSDEKFAVRLSYRIQGKNSSSFHYLDKPLSDMPEPIRFSFSAVNDARDQKPHRGPLVAYVDLCTVKEKGGNVEVVLYSNTIGVLVDVK
jgi:hypothetical protein